MYSHELSLFPLFHWNIFNWIWNIVSGLGWYIIVLVSLFSTINVVVQNVNLLFVENKSYTDFIDGFKTHGLDTWDTAAMLIMLFSGSLISPAYLFFLKDSGPKISKFASVYNAKLHKLVLSGDLHDMHMLNNIFCHFDILT